MSTERDAARIVESWLEEGPSVLPDRVLDAVLADLPAARQRPAGWLARRFPIMNSSAFRYGIAAVGVVILVVLGVNLLPGGGTGTPASTPTPTPAATPVPVIFPAEGPLSRGRHEVSQDDARFTVDITTDGWVSDGLGTESGGTFSKNGGGGSPVGAWLLFWSVDGVYADPCGHVPADAAGSSAADLAAAVAGIPELDTSAPSDTTIGGFPAKMVEVVVPADITCQANQFYLWYDATPCGQDDPCFRYVSRYDSTIRIWIVETDRGRVWIEAETYAGTTAEVQAEAQQIIDSIRFE
jgi:hypothetical protein